MTPELEQLITDWNNADQQQRFWRDKEVDLRSKLVTALYTKEKGTETVTLTAGWEIKIERGEDYKLENKNNELNDVLESFDEATAALLVKWEPKLNKKNYDVLSPELQGRFNAVLTIKPSSPQVKLIPPKV